ncbi:MAG: Uma2 family endonuclease, partial [Dehalococcoidia bacterium]
MAVSFKTYEQLALEDTDELWELVCGRLRKKPGMTAQHNEIAHALPFLLNLRLDRSRFIAGENVKVRISSGTFYIADVAIIPRELWR